MELSLGILGVLLILMGWIPETWSAWKKGRVIDIRFGILYALGSALLAFHAYEIGDVPFIILNTAALAIALLNIALAFRVNRREG